MSGSVNADNEDIDQDVKRYGSAMFMTQGKSNDFNKSYETSEMRAIPIKKKHVGLNHNKASQEMHILEKAREMNDVVLAKDRDGQFLMNRLKDRLSQGEQRRNDYLERSIEKIKEHNSSVYTKLEERAELKASLENVFPEDFIDKVNKIQKKIKDKNKMTKLYALELREKQNNAMENARERKSTLDKQIRHRLDEGIESYNSRYIEKTSRIEQETKETSRLKSALTSQRISDTK